MRGGNGGRRRSRARDGAGALGACHRQPRARQDQPSRGSSASRSYRSSSDVGRPGAVDGEGYIPSSALELPPSAAATVADAAAVLATAPARLTRATASRKHDNISRRTAVASAAAIAAVSDVGRPGAVDDEGYIPPSALEPPPSAAATVADAAAVLATAPARLTRATASRKHDKSALTKNRSTARVLSNTIRSINSTPARSQGSGYQSARRG